MFKELTLPERLLIYRRRLGFTQAQAAEHHGLQGHIYARMENGDTRYLGFMPRVEIKALQPHERCLLMRRRCGKTQEKVAAELKCSRYWLNMMELGNVPCDDLLWYWEH